MLKEQQYNEISLLDLIKAFQRRAKVFWIVVILFTILGGALTFLKHNHFSASQTFQLPAYAHQPTPSSTLQLQPIILTRDSTTVLASIIIPSVIDEYNQKHIKNPIANDSINVQMIYPPGSQPNTGQPSTPFTLTFKPAKKSQQAEIQALYNSIITKFEQHNTPLFTLFKTKNKQSLEQSLTMLNNLKADSKKLRDMKEASPTVEGEEIRAIAQMSASVVSASQSSTIEKQIDILNGKVFQLKTTLQTIQPTKPLTTLTFSEKAVGLTKSTMFILTFVLGIFLGFIAIFIAEMRDKLKSST